MTNIPNNKKKSDFIQATSIGTGSTFDFVLNGQNYKMTKADMISEFGTVGTLEQLGAVLSTPVLKTVGTDYKIRNLEDGPGVKSSVSAEDGVKLSHSFLVGDGGQAVLINPTSLTPTVRNLLAGDGITIAANGNNLLVTAVTPPTPLASNIVIVNEIADFPSPASGVITLGADSAYLVGAKLSTSHRFVLSDGTLLYGADSSVASLTYTGTGTMFTGVDASSKVTLLTIDAPTGQLFDISSTGPDVVFQFVNATVTSCDTIGTFGGVCAMQITDVLMSDIIAGGMVFTGTPTLLLCSRNVMNITAGILFDLGTAVFAKGISCEQSVFDIGAGATFLEGLVTSGNLGTGTTGVFTNNRITNAGTILSNITIDDTQWLFKFNDHIQDTTNSILAYTSSNTVSIATLNTPVVVGATWTVSHESRFTGTTAGIFTYIGKAAHVDIKVAISALLVGSPTDRNCTFYLYKNGSKLVGSGMTRALSTTKVGNLMLIWCVDLATNDTITLYAENNVNAEDITVVKAILGIIG